MVKKNSPLPDQLLAIKDSLPDLSSIFGGGMVSSNEEILRERGIYYITGEIDEGSLKDIHSDILLKHLDPMWNDDIQIIINTGGGEMDETWALLDLMDFIRMEIHTIGMGTVCSAGAILLSSGTPGKRRVSANTSLMVHPFATYGWVSGKQPEMIAQMKGVMDEQQRHIRHWLRCSNLETEEQVVKELLTPNDRWFTPEEALRLGLIDEVIPLKGKKPAVTKKKTRARR